jgi:hypothetical protein
MLCRAGDILRFAETAQPGSQATYGRGANPPRELVQAMRQLVDAGVLHPKRKREGGEFLFLVERGSAPLSAADQRRAARGYARRQNVRRSSLSMVFECLKLAAVAERPCPTNEELARRCHLSGKDAARYRVGLLVKSGRIAVEDCGPNAPRVVTVLTGRHAGKSTRRIV